MPRLAEETMEMDEDQLTQDELVEGAQIAAPEVKPRMRKPRKKKAVAVARPAATPLSAYANHLVDWQRHLKKLRDTPFPLRTVVDEPVVQTTSHPNDITDGVPMGIRRFIRGPGHAYPMDAETFAKWQAKFGDRAKEKLVEEAQVAVDTAHTRYFADGGSDYMTRRTVPAIERAVRDLLKGDGIELSSYYDPEKRQWFRLWEPTDLPPLPRRNVSRENARHDGYADEADKALSEGAYITRMTFDMFRTIEDDNWDRLGPERHKAIYKQKWRALRMMMEASVWSDNLEISRLKYIDAYLYGIERIIYSLVAADRAARFEMKQLMRANDDTEIPLLQIERKEKRLVGLRDQLRDAQINFSVAMRMRGDMVSATMIDWGDYRSIEQRATDKASRDRVKSGSHYLQSLTRSEYDHWLRHQDWRPGDGVDGQDTVE